MFESKAKKLRRAILRSIEDRDKAERQRLGMKLLKATCPNVYKAYTAALKVRI